MPLSRLTQMSVCRLRQRRDDANTQSQPLTESDQILLHNGSIFSAAYGINRLMSHVDTIGVSTFTPSTSETENSQSTNSIHGTWDGRSARDRRFRPKAESTS